MSSTLASVSFCRFVVGSEKQELSVSPAGCPTHLSLCGQRKVGQRKATPRPRPLRIPAQRVRVSRSGFSDRPSLACRKPCPHPCGQPCGRFDRLTPLPRGPVKSAGSCPQKPKREAEARSRSGRSSGCLTLGAKANLSSWPRSPLQRRNSRTCSRSWLSPSPSPSQLLLLLLLLLRAGARAFHGAPGERREFVDQPEGAPAGMPAMFVTGQGRPVHEHPRTHANPERRDARRARTRGGLSLAYLSLATQRKVGRAGRRTDRKLLLSASSDKPIPRRAWSSWWARAHPMKAVGLGRLKDGPKALALRFERQTDTEASVELMVGQGPPYEGCGVGPAEGRTESSCSPLRATNRYRGERGAHGGPGPTL